MLSPIAADWPRSLPRDLRDLPSRQAFVGMAPALFDLVGQKACKFVAQMEVLRRLKSAQTAHLRFKAVRRTLEVEQHGAHEATTFAKASAFANAARSGKARARVMLRALSRHIRVLSTAGRISVIERYSISGC
jgi:hypothetical protein